MSKNYEKVKWLYDNKSWSLNWVQDAVYRWITVAEYKEITGKEYKKS